MAERSSPVIFFETLSAMTAAQRLYERFLGRRLDKGSEALYIQKLADKLVEGKRQLRPFVRWLLKTDEFRRGL